MNNMENSQKYTPEVQALIDRLRTQCVNHNNQFIMPAHILLELCAPGTRSAELMERVVGADRLADLRSNLDVALLEPDVDEGRSAVARGTRTTTFQRMLDNARVHDVDGVLTDGENSRW